MTRRNGTCAKVFIPGRLLQSIHSPDHYLLRFHRAYPAQRVDAAFNLQWLQIPSLRPIFKMQSEQESKITLLKLLENLWNAVNVVACPVRDCGNNIIIAGEKVSSSNWPLPAEGGLARVFMTWKLCQKCLEQQASCVLCPSPEHKEFTDVVGEKVGSFLSVQGYPQAFYLHRQDAFFKMGKIEGPNGEVLKGGGFEMLTIRGSPRTVERARRIDLEALFPMQVQAWMGEGGQVLRVVLGLSSDGDGNDEEVKQDAGVDKALEKDGEMLK